MKKMLPAAASSSPATTKKPPPNSRRFSDEQIKSLESLFERENKLEARKKVEMARELGLHPRQVAIWFQNRRARWKSKQVEQDYTNLKADYDTLNHRFQSLKKEKHHLLRQLSNLCSQLKEPHERSKDLDSGSENGELNGKSSGFNEQDTGEEDDHPVKHSRKAEELENTKTGMGDMVAEDRDENVSNYDLGSLFDQSCGDWWDIWP